MKNLRNMALAAGMAAIALAVTCCSQEEEMTGHSVKGNTTIVAAFGGGEPSTRTTVNSDDKIVWTMGDKFSLFYTKDGNVGSDEFTLNSGEENKISAEFGGVTTGGATYTYAVYPKQDENNLSLDAGNVVSLTLPSAMVYTANSNGPMYAKIDNQSNLTTLSFKHLAALIRVTVGNIPTSATTFTLTADKNIAGTCTVDLDGAEPSLAVTDDDNAGKTVTVTFEKATAVSEKVFYIPIPAGKYATLTAEMKNGETSLFKKEWKDMDIKRADLCYASLNISTITGSTADVTVASSTISDINDALDAQLPSETPATGSVTTDVALSGTINTGSDADPLAIPTVANSNINLSFTSVPTATSTPLVLNDKISSSLVSEAAINTLSVAIPKSNDSDAPSLTINMPRTTVALAASNETAVYNKVVAKTANQTLVIKEGVTVKELEIAGGNVEVYGTIEKLSLASGYSTKTTVTSFGAAVIKEVTNPESDFTFTSTWDGTSKIAPTDGNIYTAAQLASYQLENIPVSTTGADLAATITSNTSLYTDVDLADHPWIGMVLDASATFDGKDHTISHIAIVEHVLSEQNIYSPEACVGLFAAAKSNSAIKNVNIQGFNASGEGANAKWAGSLLGYSNGVSLIEGCTAKDVIFASTTVNSYRVGGLIGFISGAAITVKDCSVENVAIAGDYALGGLVGTIQGSGTRTFQNCTTKDVTITLSTDRAAPIVGKFTNATTYYGSYDWSGYCSKFIGDTSADITLTSCSCSNQEFSDTEILALGYGGSWVLYKGTSTQNTLAAAKAEVEALNQKWHLAKPTNPLIPAHVDGGVITIDGTKLTAGNNYNLFTEISE